MRTFAVALLLVLVAAGHAGEVAAPRVVANGEELQGQWADANRRVAAFKGVPFAAAPVGALRWRAPQPHVPRSGPQMATGFAPACMQDDIMVDWYADVAQAFGHARDAVEKPNGVSEDCLYLNVWTPALRSEPALPVMVWIHGGSNEGGWAYEPNYVGTQLAARGVVVVSIAYRLDALGFFAHPALTSDDGEAVANFGWLDQFAALDWIAANIAVFGGDAGNVTVFGESAGAGNLLNMMGADPAAGRVHRYIAQSPATDLWERDRLEDERRNGLRIAAELGVANDSRAMERLRAVPAAEVLAAAERALPDHYYDVVLDGRALQATPLEYLDASSSVDIDLLAGSNADEWYMYLGEDTDWSDVDAWLTGHVPSQKGALRKLLSDEADPRRALDRLRTAFVMTCPMRAAAARVTAKGGNAYVYRFTRQRPGPGGRQLGAYHGAEIPYMFGTHDAWLPTTETDRRLTDTMMDLWAQFARSGDPNTGKPPRWPRYDATEPRELVLDNELDVQDVRDSEMCELFRNARREES